jgi:hypothetical protein
MIVQHWQKDNEYLENNLFHLCPSSWTGLGLNKGLRGESLVIIRLSHGTALICFRLHL